MRSKRRRKRHEQLAFPELDKNGQRRGGARPGAGRKPKGARAGSPHKRRAEVNPAHPQHVVLRAVNEVGWLRRRKAYRAVRRALTTVLDWHGDFRIVHFSLQGNHIHLLCEADHKIALARGVQGFQISAAKHLNRELSSNARKRRRGPVFADRYHVEAIDSIAQTRHALSYVLNNWRKHRQDRATVGLFGGRIDPFSSGVWFMGWKERALPCPTVPRNYEPPDVANAQTWLLTVGYQRATAISVFEVPGKSALVAHHQRRT